MDKSNKEDAMIAVIIADNLKTSFGHIQSRSPTCLMPVVNTPLLAYTIEFLIYNNISTVIIFSYEHKKIISNFIDSMSSVDINIELVKCDERPSVTTAIRELDGKDRLKGDFLLVNSHILTNIDITRAIRDHKKRKEQDKPMLMTKLFIKSSLESKIRNSQNLISIVSNDETNEILKYESMEAKKRCKVNQFFDFKKRNHSSLNVRMDLLDCDIDIVAQNTVSILEDFSNFANFKDEFVNHAIESDLISDKVYMHVIDDPKYFSRVNNPQVYFQSCMDVIHRESYPICPGSNIDTTSLIEHQNLMFHQQDSVHFKGINEKIGSFCIGENTTIGSCTTLEDSCIGAGTYIDENCEITECVIWNNVKIGPNCILKNCIITDDVEIKENSELSNLLIIEKNKQQETHEISFTYRKDNNIIEDTKSEESDLFEEESDEEQVPSSSNTFDDEIRAILLRQIKEGHSIESIKVEINSVRFSDNRSLIQCLFAIVPVLIENTMENEELNIQDAVKDLQKTFQDYSELLKSFIVSDTERASLIECIEKCWIENEKLNSGFHLLLQILWKAELLNNESIIQWADSTYEDSHELRKKFLELTKSFVDYLRKSNEESDEEEEEEDEESD